VEEFGAASRAKAEDVSGATNPPRMCLRDEIELFERGLAVALLEGDIADLTVPSVLLLKKYSDTVVFSFPNPRFHSLELE
jgi:hypothetical protein